MKRFVVSRVRYGSPDFAAAKRAEFQVFGLCNSFATSEDRTAGEMTAYRSHESLSEFYIACEGTTVGYVAGISRLIRHSESRGMESFPTIRDARWYGVPGKPSACYLNRGWAELIERANAAEYAELATQAIAPMFRRPGAMEEIWAEIIDVCRADGVRYWMVALTVPLFRRYKMMFPTALQAIGQVMPNYVGADSVPGVFSIDHREVQKYREFVSASLWNATSSRGEAPRMASDVSALDRNTGAYCGV